MYAVRVRFTLYMSSVFIRVCTCDIKVSCCEAPSFISPVCHLFSVIMTFCFFTVIRKEISDQYNRFSYFDYCDIKHEER